MAQPTPPPLCERCGRYPARYICFSDILRLRICEACAIEAREIQRRAKGPGAMTILPIEKEPETQH